MAGGSTGQDLEHGVLELLSSLVCLHDGHHILFMNAAGARMLDLPSPNAAIGLPFETWVVPDYRFLTEAGWDLLAEEDFLPLKLARADGSIFEAELRVRQANDRFFLVEGRDISKFVRSAEALREREERLQGILASVAEGILTVNDSGRIESANPACEAMFGFDRGKMVGVDLGDLMPPDLRDRHQRFFDAYMSGLFPTLMGRLVEGVGLRRNGASFPMEVSVSELRHGRQRLFTAILRDISERKENEDRIRRQAHHDPLTGLPNRNLLDDRMNHALARARRTGGRLAILYVDLDRFKPVNDTLGHEAGDHVLQEVAKRLAGCVRAADTVARVGGDEFVVLIEGVQRPSEATVVARKIIETLARPMEYQGHSCHVGASVGVAIFPNDGANMEEVFRAADMAMYRVKHAGRNGIGGYGPAGEHVEEFL